MVVTWCHLLRHEGAWGVAWSCWGLLGSQHGCSRVHEKPKELPGRPQEHQKRPQNMEIIIHRPCRRFRASQVTIYRPSRVIMNAAKRSKGKEDADKTKIGHLMRPLRGDEIDFATTVDTNVKLPKYARGKQTVVKKRKKNKRRNARLKHCGE